MAAAIRSGVAVAHGGNHRAPQIHRLPNIGPGRNDMLLQPLLGSPPIPGQGFDHLIKSQQGRRLQRRSPHQPLESTQRRHAPRLLFDGPSIFKSKRRLPHMLLSGAAANDLDALGSPVQVARAGCSAEIPPKSLMNTDFLRRPEIASRVVTECCLGGRRAREVAKRVVNYGRSRQELCTRNCRQCPSAVPPADRPVLEATPILDSSCSFPYSPLLRGLLPSCSLLPGSTARVVTIGPPCRHRATTTPARGESEVRNWFVACRVPGEFGYDSPWGGPHGTVEQALLRDHSAWE